MTKFCRFDLRTTDANAARTFYTRVLGHDRATVWPLHEQARARGAMPHWLGRIGVDDVERAAAALVDRGATRFGPTIAMSDGGRATVLRDPGGAVVAVGTPPTSDAGSEVDVVWHALNTNDAARAMENYRDLFGWQPTNSVELGAAGTLQQFAWQPDGATVGAVIDVAGRPGVHPHWLFFFAVPSLDSAIATTRDAGGQVLPPLVLPSGERACVCDDPQGAAFGLLERQLC